MASATGLGIGDTVEHAKGITTVDDLSRKDTEGDLSPGGRTGVLGIACLPPRFDGPLVLWDCLREVDISILACQQLGNLIA